MSVRYVADSLEDVAAEFDRFAERAASTAARSQSKRQQAVNNAESRTWTRAAEILRATELKSAARARREVV